MVGAKSRMKDRGVRSRVPTAVNAAQAWISLVHGAAVRAGIEVTGSAGGKAVTAELHVPEKCFAQRDCGLLIANHITQLSRGGTRNRNCPQSSELALVIGRVVGRLVVSASAFITGSAWRGAHRIPVVTAVVSAAIVSTTTISTATVSTAALAAA